MKVSDAINILELVLDQYGDLEVVHVSEVEEGYRIEYNKVLEVIEPLEDSVYNEKVVALITPDLVEEKYKPELKLITNNNEEMN